MSTIKTLVSSVAALTIMFGGAVQAGSHDKTEKMIKGQEEMAKDEPYPQSIKDPTPDMKKQAKTEKMLKGQKEMAKDEPYPQSIKDPAPDMKKQAKTEKMIKAQEAAAKDEPR